MLQRQLKDPDCFRQSELSFLDRLLGDYHPRQFVVRFCDGTTWGPEPGQPARFTLVLCHPDSLKGMFWPPGELTLGEAFIYGDFNIEGDLEAAFSLADYLSDQVDRIVDIQLLKTMHRLCFTPSRRVGRRGAMLRGTVHSIERDRQAVTYHYSVSNAFYRLWLDRNMVYSCAYFASPEEDLDTTQERKLDYICRKLRLQPGDRLLDIGCGWGGLILHAAKHYGAQARGITMSASQADFANERIRAAGLSGVCRADVADYRDLNEPDAYDRIISVGMVEHVGASNLSEYFKRAWRLLKPCERSAALHVRGCPLLYYRKAQRVPVPSGQTR